MFTTTKFSKLLLTFTALILVSACSTDDEAAMEDGSAMGMEGTQNTALNDVYGDGSGAAPGTQADLVANVGDRVFFGYDRHDLAPEARTVLEAQAQWLAQYPTLAVTVEGHADERGTREYNLALGERRANSVKNYLVALGVDPSRINTISYGKERPAVPGSDESAWTQNRRGVTKVN
jgi:peptidoglycan-associated lipoprotein